MRCLTSWQAAGLGGQPFHGIDNSFAQYKEEIPDTPPDNTDLDHECYLAALVVNVVIWEDGRQTSGYRSSAPASSKAPP